MSFFKRTDILYRGFQESNLMMKEYISCGYKKICSLPFLKPLETFGFLHPMLIGGRAFGNLEYSTIYHRSR